MSDETIDGNLYVTGFINGSGASSPPDAGITGLAATSFASPIGQNLVLAGPTDAPGAAAFRSLDGSDLPFATTLVHGAFLSDVNAGAPPLPSVLSALSAQGWHTDVYPAPYMVGASTHDDAGAPSIVDGTLEHGVTVQSFDAWFPGLGRVTVPANTITNAPSSVPRLTPGVNPVDYILSHDGTQWYRDPVSVGYPPFLTMTATPPRLLIARITCSSAGITNIYDLRARHPAPHPTHEIDLVALGADPTGQSDSTAAVQAALDMAAKGDGSCKIIVPPNSWIRCDGQLVVRGNNRAGLTTFNIANGLWLQGSPHGGQHQFIIAGGSVLDLRWDGGLDLMGTRFSRRSWASLRTPSSRVDRRGAEGSNVRRTGTGTLVSSTVRCLSQSVNRAEHARSVTSNISVILPCILDRGVLQWGYPT